MNSKLIAFFATCLVGTMAFSRQFVSASKIYTGGSGRGEEIFDKVKSRLVIIKGTNGSGSGIFGDRPRESTFLR